MVGQIPAFQNISRAMLDLPNKMASRTYMCHGLRERTISILMTILNLKDAGNGEPGDNLY